MATHLDEGESTTNIVDCDLLEAAKENVQPLAMGRRVTALSDILATPHVQREAKLSATRSRLRVNVELALEDEDGDPLEAYSRLVYWTVENYPHGHSAESGLLELLEEATRVLKEDRNGKWRGELKYLKLWLLYASYVEKPTIIYKFLIANEIGTHYALLYEEHAAVLERDGRRREADDAYALGIARKAQPLGHLENRYEDFQKRMMSNIARPPPQPAPSRNNRQALTSVSSQTSSSQSSRGSLPRTTLPSSSSSIQTPQSNSRLQIFVDPTGEGAQSADLAATSSNTNEWNELGTRKTRIKENAPETKKMVGSTIKQPGKSKRLADGPPGTGSSSKIAVFRDPAPMEVLPSTSTQRACASGSSSSAVKGFVPFMDEQQDNAKSAAAVAHSSSTPVTRFTPFRDESAASSSAATALQATDSVMKVKKTDKKVQEPTSEAEALRKDPLKNYPQGVFRGSGVDSQDD